MKKRQRKYWIQELNSRLTFYYHLPVVEKCLKKCLTCDKNKRYVTNKCDI